MAHYLVVAHQTADGPELAAALRAVRARDPNSPSCWWCHLLASNICGDGPRGEARAAATQSGKKAFEQLKRHGMKLAAVRIGDADPVDAAVDEWNDHPEYDEVIFSTFPGGVSRWLKVDAYDRLVRRVPTPVTHVVAQARHRDEWLRSADDQNRRGRACAGGHPRLRSWTSTRYRARG